MDGSPPFPARHKLDTAAYHRMAEAGIFGHEDRIELIDGDLIDMAPIGYGHASLVSSLTEALVIACAGRAIVWPQNPVLIDRASEPQPDVTVIRARADRYATGNPPGPADILLLIEVADSSLRYDREVKLPLYARAGIPELWIVDLKRRAVNVFRTPAGDAYGSMTAHQSGDRIALALAPEIIVHLDLVFA